MKKILKCVYYVDIYIVYKIPTGRQFDGTTARMMTRTRVCPSLVISYAFRYIYIIFFWVRSAHSLAKSGIHSKRFLSGIADTAHIYKYNNIYSYIHA